MRSFDSRWHLLGRAIRLTATILSGALLALIVVAPATAPEATWKAEVADRVGKELETRRIDRPTETARGLRDVFAASVHAVPLIITESGRGSGVMVWVDGNSRRGLVVTNHHVAATAFRDEHAKHFVVLVFYEPRLAFEPLEGERIANCLTSRSASSWCRVFLSVVRVGFVLRSDPDRDLALLEVAEVPPGIRPISPGNLAGIRVGDQVSVIGHPLNLLWSLTTGIVSSVRGGFRVGNSPDSAPVTVIQTQAPLNPGNSGGPLLADDGRLVGVVFSSGLVEVQSDTGSKVKVSAEGLNFAIAINEVLEFIAQEARRPIR